MTLVMGVLNVTPDSFSDGGTHDTPVEALAHARGLIADGAAIIDVGGESTRPGAPRVPVQEELRRVVPVVRALADEGMHVSVDTMRSEVAEASIEAGAAIINDVSGGLADPRILRVVASAPDVEYVLMHWRSHSATMQEDSVYDDVLTEVISEVLRARDAAVAAGIDPGRIILDPGIGFSKTAEQNWVLLRGIEEFQALDHRVLVGVSRKRFLGEVLGGREPLGRDAATAAVTTFCALHDVWAVRTHEVAMQVDAARVSEQLRG